MKILIALRHYRISGVVTWSNVTARALASLGHEVHVWFRDRETNDMSMVAKFFEYKVFLGDCPQDDYDLALCNYTDLADACMRVAKRTHFIKHGTMFDLYKPPEGVDTVVCLSGRSYELEPSENKALVENYIEDNIDIRRPASTPVTRALICDIRSMYDWRPIVLLLESRGIDCHELTQLTNPQGVPDIQKHFDSYDIVVGYGRVVREAMLAGRHVWVHGANGGCGFITSDTYDAAHYRNFSGWVLNVKESIEQASSYLSDISTSYKIGESQCTWNRSKALEELVVSSKHLETLIKGCES